MKRSVLFGAVRERSNTAKVMGREILYRLYAVGCPRTRFYIIEVENDTESCVRCFGKEKRAAIDIYKKIVECSVTPCTLDDIADDFAKSTNQR